MGLFGNNRNQDKDIVKDFDNRLPVVIFFDIYFRKFWNLILINLLYILFCLPIITIGPATAGVTKLLRNYAREEHAFIWADFFETFKKNFWKAILIFLIDLFAIALILFDLYMYIALNASPIIRTISLAVVMLSGTILLFMNYYIYTMLITFNLSFGQLLKNAFIFAWIGFWRNLLVTIFLALITVLIVLYFDTLGPIILLFIYFSTCGLIVNFITFPLIRKHMIDGRDPNTGEKITDK